MNHLFDYWAALNTVLIMLGLGLAFDGRRLDLHYAVLARAILAYNVIIPLSGWLVIGFATTWFGDDVLLAMLLCILCAGGTSAGTFVSRVSGSAPLAGTLIVVLVAFSLLSLTALSVAGLQFLGLSAFDRLPVTQLAGYLLLITLVPFLLGIAVTHRYSGWSHRWLPRVDRAGSVLTLLLVIALTLRYTAEILSGPAEPLYAAVLLVMLFMLAPLAMERDRIQRRTVILITLIRNLTLVLSLMAILPDAETLLPTVLAFGLGMYLVAGGLVLAWRK